MPSMVHFVVTRFNLRPSVAVTGKALDVKWLESRFELFERFCWPSLKGQTEQNFKWLVLFDEATPEPIRQRIAGYARWPNFVPVYLPAGTEHSARTAVAKVLAGALPEVLITTRLDNDDGISLDYIEHIQRYAQATVPTVVEFPVGYIWHNDRLYRDRQPHNAFTSLIEPLKACGATTFSTIYSGSHTEVENLGRVECVSNQPSWLQVVHGGNLENRPRGVRCSLRELDGRFAVEHAQLAAAEDALGLQLDRLRTALLTAVTDTLRAIKRSARRVLKSA